VGRPRERPAFLRPLQPHARRRELLHRVPRREGPLTSLSSLSSFLSPSLLSPSDSRRPARMARSKVPNPSQHIVSFPPAPKAPKNPESAAGRASASPATRDALHHHATPRSTRHAARPRAIFPVFLDGFTTLHAPRSWGRSGVRHRRDFARAPARRQHPSPSLAPRRGLRPSR
jgi:hypothetical protein